MSATQFVGRPVLFPSPIPEWPGQTLLSLCSDAGWKESFGAAGDSVPLACVMGGEEGASVLSHPAPALALLQALVVVSETRGGLCLQQGIIC